MEAVRFSMNVYNEQANTLNVPISSHLFTLSWGLFVASVWV